jgi:hypothetical protein
MAELGNLSTVPDHQVADPEDHPQTERA